MLLLICIKPHPNVSEQTILLDGLNVGLPKSCVYGSGLNRFSHEGMNDISNVKVHLKTCSGNVNIFNITMSLVLQLQEN